MTRIFRYRTLAALFALAGCGTGPSSAVVTPAPPPTVRTAAPSTAPTPPPASPGAPNGPLHITAPGCGYGGSAPAMTVFVDVSSDVALHGVTATFR